MSILSKDRICSMVTGTVGKELAIYEEVDSTNNVAKLLARNGAPHGAVVVAERQSAGKGRLGRSFFSPPGAGMYLTVILRPKLSLEEALLVTPAAAVATSRAIERVTGIRVQIKWVNDLYHQGKKLCGILAESALSPSGSLDFLVLGIGVNIFTGSFPPELEDVATSLSAIRGDQQIDRDRLIAETLNCLDEVCGQLQSREFLAEYRGRSCVLGKEVQMLRGDSVRTVRVLEIDQNANLVVAGEDGARLVIGSGEVTLKGDWR